MTNLEIANEVLDSKKVIFELSHSCNEKPSEEYLEKLKSKIGDEWTGEVYEELVPLGEVDDFYRYIVHNILEQVSGEVSVNKHYESISIEIILK